MTDDSAVTTWRATNVAPIDIALGLAGEVVTRACRAGAPLRWMAELALAAAPSSVAAAMADRGRAVRGVAEQLAQQALVTVVVPAARSVLAGVDLTQLLREHVDLIGIAEEVVAAINLPEIIRQSGDVAASEAIRGVRAGGMHADDAVAGLVDRVFRRGGGTAGQTSG
ncbi:MAG TPA: hypothetical protein VFX16_10685 [Pseudonocardiaceae bacterium]|nr:hypothetical protein [Pseudonocardiaceae bacterium]